MRWDTIWLERARATREQREPVYMGRQTMAEKAKETEQWQM
jgi:hypothetical protein